MSNLHKDALADAKKLREIAEANAKSAILEEITPRIKEMIERELLAESKDDDDDEDEDDEKELMFDSSDKEESDDSDKEEAEDDDEEDVELTQESIEALAKIAGAKAEGYGVRALQIASKLEEIHSVSVDDATYCEKLKQIKLTIENCYKSLQSDKGQKVIPQDTALVIESKLEELYTATNNLYLPAKSALIETKVTALDKKSRQFKTLSEGYDLSESKKFFGESCSGMLKEAGLLRESLAELQEIAENSKVDQLYKRVNELVKEIYTMAKRTLSEEELKLIIRGLDTEDPEGSELSAEVEPADDMELDDLEGDEDDLGGEEDLELDMADSAEEEPLEMESEDKQDAMKENEEIEISEVVLTQELKRLKSRRAALREEQATQHSPGGGPDHFDNFGGGSEDGEALDDVEMNDQDPVGTGASVAEGEEVELSEAELQELLGGQRYRASGGRGRNWSKMRSIAMKRSAEKEADAEKAEEEPKEPEAKAEAEEMMETLQKYKTAVSQLKKHNVKLESELRQANLFNAKLMYANKLMQNENLSSKQRVTILEALDEAETVREVKNLFARLNEVFSGKDEAKDKLTEGKKDVQSVLKSGSSRATKPGSSLNESEQKEYTRWGELAGFLNE